jgi:hypothetical protein
VGRQRSFYELFLRGGNAADRFANPGSGTPVLIERIDRE